jgi:hypothetical protein
VRKLAAGGGGAVEVMGDSGTRPDTAHAIGADSLGAVGADTGQAAAGDSTSQ